MRLVESVDSILEEGMLHLVVFFLWHGNLLSWLVVAKVSSLLEHSHVCGWVDLLKTHLKLVEKTKSETSLPLHDLVHHLGVELDVKVAQSWLQLLKILKFVRNRVPKAIEKQRRD